MSFYLVAENLMYRIATVVIHKCVFFHKYPKYPKQHLCVCSRVPRKDEALSNVSDVIECQTQAEPHNDFVSHLPVDLLRNLVGSTVSTERMSSSFT